jgi:hypothetical protein
MYIAIAILAALFTITPAKTQKPAAPAAAHAQSVPSVVKESPVLIDTRFSRKNAVMPWEKNDDPAELMPSAKTC